MVLRELLVQLGLKVDEKSVEKGQRTLEGIKALGEEVVESFKDKAKEFLVEEGGLLAKLGLVGAAVGYATHLLLEHTEQVAEMGFATGELSQKVGIEVEQLQTLSGAFELAGASNDAFAVGIGVLSRNMLEAKQGSQEALKSFRQLGVNVFDASGKLRPTDDVLYDIADKFKTMPRGAEKTGLAMQLLGRGGKEMIPALSKGSEELKKLGAETYSFTKEQIEASEAYVLAQKRGAAQVANFWKSVIAPLLPVMVKFRELINRTTKAYLDWVSPFVRAGFAIIAETLKVIGSAVLLIVKGLIWWGGGFVKLFTLWFKYAKAMWDSLTKTQKIAVGVALAIGAAFLLATSPFLLMAAAIAGVLLFLDDLRVFLDGGDSVIGRLIDHIKKWVNAKYADSPFMQFLGGVVDFFKRTIAYVEKLSLAVLKAGRATGVLSEEQFDKLTRKSDAEKKSDSNKQTISTAKARLGMGQQLTKAERDALEAEGVNAADFAKQNFHAAKATHRPKRAATHRAAADAGGAGGGEAVSIDARTTIHITQRPGEDNKELAARIDERIDKRRQQHLQAAKAAVR